MTETIADIKAALTTIGSSDARLKLWAQDSRKGVRRLVERYQRQQIKLQAKIEHFHHRFDFEQRYWENGYINIAGIDEVGRGPLAGPVVAAAVILKHDFNLIDVIDSKQLSAHQRLELDQKIRQQALAIGIAQVDADVIDQVNIYQASRQAMLLAAQQLNPQPQALLIDAMQIDSPLAQESLIKGDARSNSIAAASIIAKVSRDQLMADYAKKYPGYGFEHNAGYGTAEHLAAIKQQGICPVHRRTFAPIKDWIATP